MEEDGVVVFCGDFQCGQELWSLVEAMIPLTTLLQSFQYWWLYQWPTFSYLPAPFLLINHLKMTYQYLHRLDHKVQYAIKISKFSTHD